MTESRGSARFLGSFLLGILSGSIGMFWYLNPSKTEPSIHFRGRITLDTASYETPYLNNAIYLERPTTVEDRIYLHFQDNAAMNAAIGKMVVVSGHLKTVDIGDGESVIELEVVSVEHLSQ